MSNQQHSPAGRAPSQADHSDLLAASPHLVPTPLDRSFYDELIAALATASRSSTVTLDDLSGATVDLRAGETITIELVEGPQIVNLFAFNPHDPDERMWHMSVLRDGLFPTVGNRIWSTMARNRPMLTFLEDTVCADPRGPFGQHHLYFGGSGTPADWRFGGGDESVRTTWQQLAEQLSARGASPSLLLENLCLFQKATVDVRPMRVEILPSDAVAGDRVTLFAEIDLTVALALSPYIDGARPASTPGLPAPRRVDVHVGERLAAPLPWPYPGLSYPDLSLYLDEHGVRSREPVTTAGIDYRVRREGKETTA
ncbi:urea carboxylase-associated family protein [Conexibacter sp. CPCC 206217]|uniref:urea carboxylase-associated family protein n=1 Tax=Conexibacter sp. CPCC 206217 TaxID=3064574 RepID=UPI0027250C5D|nr:urea carboxylase-associated family protein [Conexibacter sp. CPCC 206217]MDO8210181.1 urea carboxylase-associated family protein [Conexibacter sp. CPCC 206217]